MSPLVVIALINLAQKIGMKAMENRNKKPIEKWTDADALKWINDYEFGMISTDDILGPPEKD